MTPAFVPVQMYPLIGEGEFCMVLPFSVKMGDQVTVEGKLYSINWHGPTFDLYEKAWVYLRGYNSLPEGRMCPLG